MEQHRHLDQQMGEGVMEYAEMLMIRIWNMVGRGPEEEMTKLLNNMVREEDQNMEVTVVMVDVEEMGVWLEEEGPKNQQCDTFRVGEEENKVFAVSHL